MSDPVTQTAVDTVVQMLAAIHTGDGYFTDLGAGPISSEPGALAGIAGPFVGVVEESVEPMFDPAGRPMPRRYWMNLVVEVCTPRSDRAWRESRRARADVLRALDRPLRHKPSGVLEIQVSGAQRIVDDDHRIAKHVVAQVSVRVGVVEPRPDD